MPASMAKPTSPTSKRCKVPRAHIFALGLIALVALTLIPQTANATNYSLYDMSTDGAWRSTAGTTHLAQAFSTHSVGRYLSSVRVQIRNSNEANSSSVPSTFSASLWSSSAGLPLSKIADLAANQSIGAWGDGSFTFTPVSEITLGTTPATYFIVVAGSAGGTVGWKCNASSPTAAEPVGSYPTATSTNSGASWSTIASGACFGQYFNMTVIATDVSSSTTTTQATTTTTQVTTTTTQATTTTTLGPAATTAPTTTLATVPTTTRPAVTTTTLEQSTAVPNNSQASTTTSTTLQTTTTTPPQPNTSPSNTPPAPSTFFDNDINAQVTVLGSAGTLVDQVRVVIDASGLQPSSPVVLTLYSDPVTLLTGTATQNGAFAAETQIPPSVGPGDHTIVLDTITVTGAQRAMGTITLDATLRVTSLTQPSAVSPDIEPTSVMVTRAKTSGEQMYDAMSQPATTGALAVAATALLSLMGSGLSSAGAGISRQRDARGKLAGFVTKKLKATQPTTTAWGDNSITWRLPLTHTTDSISQRLPQRVGKFSASLPRMAVDGSWLRASLGSAGYSLWILGFLAGLASGMSFNSIVAPSAIAATVFACVGIFDSGAGMAAWLGTVLGVVIAGNIADWYDIRTLLGMAVLYTGLAPLAHVIRPLRRMVSNRADFIERIFDYIITPIFLAFAGGSMLKALNGLSALKLVSSSDVTRAMWLFGIFIVVRFMCEDIIRQFYPERMAHVQPQKLVSPSRTTSLLSVLPRSAIILFVAVPFFGFTWKTLLSTGLLALPVLLKPFEDDLPNSVFIHKWLPRGLFRFLCLLVVGLWMSSMLVPTNNPQSARDAAVWLLIPGVVVGVVEGFGREGGDWSNTRVKWGLGAVVWLCAAGIVTGIITLF